MSFYIPEAAKAQADVTTYHIEGLAREGMTPFGMSLISHVQDNLWQGGCIDGLSLPDDFQFVLSLYDREQYKLGEDTFRIQVDQMYDSGTNMFPDRDLYKLARVLRAFMRAGKTLVHCQAGLNRSGLLAGLALVLDGASPAAAIALLRKSRSEAVLCNLAFQDWLLAQPAGGA